MFMQMPQNNVMFVVFVSFSLLTKHANSQKLIDTTTMQDTTTDKVNTRWPLTLLYLPKMYLPTGDRAVGAAHNTDEPTNTRWPSILCTPSAIEWDSGLHGIQGADFIGHHYTEPHIDKCSIIRSLKIGMEVKPANRTWNASDHWAGWFGGTEKNKQ